MFRHFIRDDDSQHIGSIGIAVDIDLLDQPTAGLKPGAQRSDGDILTLAELENVLAPVDQHHIIGCTFLNDVAAADKPLLVKQAGIRLGCLVVAPDLVAGPEAQFAPGVRLIGAVVAQFRDIPELVGDHIAAVDHVIGCHASSAGFSIAIALLHVDIETVDHELLHRRGRGCRTNDAQHHAIAKKSVPHGLHHFGAGIFLFCPGLHLAGHFILVVLVNHLEHTGKERQGRGPRQADVLKQGGHIRLQGEISGRSTPQ